MNWENFPCLRKILLLLLSNFPPPLTFTIRALTASYLVFLSSPDILWIRNKLKTLSHHGLTYLSWNTLIDLSGIFNWIKGFWIALFYYSDHFLQFLALYNCINYLHISIFTLGIHNRNTKSGLWSLSLSSHSFLSTITLITRVPMASFLQ